MSDASVARALRSPHRLVVIEAPGGCGKTFQGADYARELGGRIAPGRLLILTHTHAACDVFAEKTRGLLGRVEIRTIDSLIADIVLAYPRPCALAEDTANPDYAAHATWAARVLAQAPFVAQSLANRYPVVICDEHQDASPDQHAIVMALHQAGAALRIFGDPMQLIYATGRSGVDLDRDLARWADLCAQADLADHLDYPHRWRDGGEELGQWILEARTDLQAGRPIRLNGSRPAGLSIVVADNSPARALGFRLDRAVRGPIDAVLRKPQPLMLLSRHGDTGHAIRAFFGRSLPIWEGHTRSALPKLTQALAVAQDAGAVTEAAIGFCQEVCTGFTDGQFADRLRNEVSSGCARPATGKPRHIQGLARHLLDCPDHRGVGAFLTGLHAIIRAEAAFVGVHIDYPHEYWEAARLGDHVDLRSGVADQALRRRIVRRPPPERVISTVHKAKGLEAPNVMVMPCDAATFKEKDRRLLYVAISRATRSLTLVVSGSNPSPLLSI